MTALNKKPKFDLEHYRIELQENGPLQRTYEAALKEGRVKELDETYEDAAYSPKGAEGRIANFYALIREIRPKTIVETGTAGGLTASWFLSALEKNGEGKLISIDIPPREGRLTMDISISREDIGYFVPKEYRHRWEYIEGDSREYLPKVLLENQADVFLHDSLHTRSHMLFEYSVAHTLMKPGSIIMSDDILWNSAFFNFVASNHLRSFSCISNPNIGFIVNDFDEFEKEIGTGIVQLRKEK